METEDNKHRVIEDWMDLVDESIFELDEDDWIHYKRGGCLCFSHSTAECVCGAWYKD